MKDKIKQFVAKRPRRKKKAPEKLEQAIQTLPRITNETVAEHREEVLSSARKYIYPLKHSAHRVVFISTILFVVVLIASLTVCLLALYKFNSTSTFTYRVTQVVPFPVAKAGSRWVSYENYLFELRHYMHYYQTQQDVDFDTESGKEQLQDFRKRALSRAVDNAYIKQLAAEQDISVSTQELEEAIALVRDQNRLGGNDEVFAEVLKEFWGWSVDDFKRELRQQMLAQKVVSTLDLETHKRADDAFDRLQKGEDFATIAKQVSDDTATKENGGSYGIDIDKSDRNLSPQVIDALFKLKPGQTSAIINTGTTLEILKVNEVAAEKVRASHIMFTFKPIDTYIGPLKEKDKPRTFVHP